MAKYTYSVESFFEGKWVKLFSETRDYCAGYINHAQYEHPRPTIRITRNDGKIIHEIKSDPDVSIGMIASWPTPEQYEAAAARALEQAAHWRKVREKMDKQNSA